MSLNVMVGRKLRRLNAGSLVAFEIKSPDIFGGFMVRFDGCQPSLITGLGEPSTKEWLETLMQTDTPGDDPC